MKYKYIMWMIVVHVLLNKAYCSTFNDFKFGYSSVFLPDGDYNKNISTCASDSECRLRYTNYS